MTLTVSIQSIENHIEYMKWLEIIQIRKLIYSIMKEDFNSRLSIIYLVQLFIDSMLLNEDIN